MMNKLHPHRFMFHTPIYEIKLEATIIPKSAGYQSPSFLIEGENTAGRLKTIHIKPMIQTMVINTGLFLTTTAIL